MAPFNTNTRARVHTHTHTLTYWRRRLSVDNFHYILHVGKTITLASHIYFFASLFLFACVYQCAVVWLVFAVQMYCMMFLCMRVCVWERARHARVYVCVCVGLSHTHAHAHGECFNCQVIYGGNYLCMRGKRERRSGICGETVAGVICRHSWASASGKCTCVRVCFFFSQYPHSIFMMLHYTINKYTEG